MSKDLWTVGAAVALLLLFATTAFAIGEPVPKSAPIPAATIPGESATPDRSNDPLWLTGPSAPLQAHPGLLAKTTGQSFTVAGIQQDSSAFGWTASSRTLSAYADGLLARQATVNLSGGGGTAAPVTTHLYKYNARGLVTEDRVPTSHVASYYTYNDSGRTSQMLTAFDDGTPTMRYTYTYQNLVTLQARLYEYYSAGVWRTASRTTYYNYVAGFPDSLVVENWAGSFWQQFSKTAYNRPRADSVIAIFSYWNSSTLSWATSSRYTYLYDPQLRLLYAQMESYSSETWVLSLRWSYTYDADGVQLAWTRWYFSGIAWLTASKYEAVKTPAPAILLASPNAGDRYFPGDTIAVQWLGTGEDPVNVEYSSNNGGAWNQITSGQPDTGISVYWWVPSVPSNTIKIRVVAGSASSTMMDPFMVLTGQRFLVQTTSNVQCGVFSAGYLGADGSGIGPGFQYKGGANALYSAGVIVNSTQAGTIRGMIGSYSTANFSPSVALTNFASDGVFNQRSVCTITERPPFYGIQIAQRTASRNGDDFIFVVYDVKNVTTSVLPNFYIGIYADWDIGNYSVNLGGLDTARGLAYQYDASALDSNFYGIVALTGMTGAAIDASSPIPPYMWSRWAVATTPADYRTCIASGPYVIAPGAIGSAGFAIAAGGSLPALQARADSARALWKRTVWTSVPQGAVSRDFTLDQNYPNPFNPSTTIRYGLPIRSHVTLTVYSTLGQQVAILQNGEQESGFHEVKFDGSGLSSGVYFYRLQAGDFLQTKRFLFLK